MPGDVIEGPTSGRLLRITTVDTMRASAVDEKGNPVLLRKRGGQWEEV